MSVTAEVLEIVKEMPGCTSAEVVALMSHVKAQTVYARLDMLKTRGDIRQERDDKRRVHWYMNETPKPIAPRRGKVKKDAVIELTCVQSPKQAAAAAKYIFDRNNEPKGISSFVPEVAQAHYQSAIARLQSQVIELELWKADAIKRYPDLAIPPLLKRAREIVADELRASGENDMAEKVVAGKNDKSLAVRLVLKMLEGETA